jgi:hypothetical protein
MCGTREWLRCIVTCVYGVCAMQTAQQLLPPCVAEVAAVAAATAAGSKTMQCQSYCRSLLLSQLLQRNVHSAAAGWRRCSNAIPPNEHPFSLLILG